MPALSKLTAPNPRPIKVEWGDATVNATYDANKLTPAFLDDQIDAAKAAAAAAPGGMVSPGKVVGGVLVELLLSWDITATDDDPTPLPLTAENMALLPTELLEGLRDAMAGAARPPGKRSGSFGSG
jgi:hypothetical protein